MVDSKDPMGLINLLESGDVQTTEDVKLLIKNELQSGMAYVLRNKLQRSNPVLTVDKC